MRFTRFSIAFLITLQFLFSSLLIYASKIPSNLARSVFSIDERQIGSLSDCYAGHSTCRSDIHTYSTSKLATRNGEPLPSASKLLSLLYPKAPDCLDAIEQKCSTVFTAIRDATANNTSAASLYRNITSSTCLNVCSSGTDPMKWVQWLTKFSQSAIVKADFNQTSLQDDWIDWPTVSRRARAAIVPWKWILVANLSASRDPDVAPNDPDTNLQCPKRSSILWSFAVINICLVISGIIFARRDIINRLTCGSLGKPPIEEAADGFWERGYYMVACWWHPRPQEKAVADQSRTLGYTWFFGGLVTVSLSIAANFINAVIVRSTPGFTGTPPAPLAILWITRPRVGWFVLLWTNIGSVKNTYVSAAWSAVFAELLLQIGGSWYLLQTANYGVKSGFFSIATFQDIPDGRWGLVMYAGVILWIATIGLMLPCALAIIYSGAATAREVRFSPKVHTKHRRMHFQWAFFFVAFIGQWMFWIGYVNIASDTYCPPRIWHSTGVWVAFGVVISTIGGAF